MTDIRFGTDGWRAVIAEDYTFDNVRRCAQGFAQFLRDTAQGERGLVVGYDYRFDSEHFAAAAAEVLAGNGIPVHLCARAMPTPVISYAILDRKAAGAVNITASHNPPTDNGFKVRADYGGAVAPEDLKQIESRIPASISGVRRMSQEEAKQRGLLTLFDPTEAFLAQVARMVDVEPIRQAGLKVVMDAMWGVGSGWFPGILAGGKTEVVEIHNVRNPIFPEMDRPEPIPPNIDPLLRAVVAEGADIGIATDGDADRMGAATEKGQFLNQLQVYALIALYLLEVRGWRGPIVKTVSTTSMLERLGERYNVPVYETGVGFKYVAPKMLETDAMVGGEESGGYAFRGHIPERDGIVANLFLLDMVVRMEKKPSELLDYLFSIVGPHFYHRRDTGFPADQRQQILQRLENSKPDKLAGLAVREVVRTDGFKFMLEDGGWLLIRFSGTEPIMRIYTETTREDKVDPILDAGMELAGLGQ